MSGSINSFGNDRDKPEADTTQTDGEWLILKDMGGVGAELVQRMQSKGLRAHTLSNLAEAQTLIASDHGQSYAGIVHLWGMDASEAEPDTALLSSLNVVQSFSGAKRPAESTGS